MTEPFVILIVVILVAAILAIVFMRPAKQRNVRSMYTEGLDHLLRGQLKRAYSSFKGVIEKDTDHISAYLKMGQVMRLGGAADKALKLHESLLARTTLTNYELQELYKNLALDYNVLGKYAKAIEWALALLKIDKRNTWALSHLVKFYSNQGDCISGGKYLVQWQKAKDQVDTQLRAFCRFRQGYDRRTSDPADTVRSHYQQALKIDESFAPAHYYLADSYANEGNTVRAEMATLEEAGDKKSVRRKEVLSSQINKSYGQAIAHWSLFVEQSPQDTYRVLHRVEDALYFLQRFDDIEPFLKQILERDEKNLDGIAGLANFYVRKGELDKAEQLLATVSVDSDHEPLISAIRLKLDYRRNTDLNLMTELDRLVDTIRENAISRASSAGEKSSLMNWLNPESDPLDKLA